MSREEWEPGDLTAQYYKDVLFVEAASDVLDEELFSRMLDTYAELCRREGREEARLSRPIGAEEWDERDAELGEEVDELTEELADATDSTPEEIEQGAAGIDIEPPEEAGVEGLLEDDEVITMEEAREGTAEKIEEFEEDEPSQTGWRDIRPPDEVTFADDAVPHGTQRIVNELIEHHKDEYRPHWAVYMGLLDRLPDVPGDYAEFNNLHSAADPWDSEVAYEALEDLTTLYDGCFAVHANGPTFEDSELYSITQVGEAIKEWWTSSKYDQLRD